MTHSASANSRDIRNPGDRFDRHGQHLGSPGNGHRVLDGIQLNGSRLEEGDVDVELHHLRRRIATLPVIEQAKGILMSRYGVDADTAFDVLRRLACDNNIKLRDVSRSIVAAATSNPSITGPRPSLGELLRDLMFGSDSAE